MAKYLDRLRVCIYEAEPLAPEAGKLTKTLGEKSMESFNFLESFS